MCTHTFFFITVNIKHDNSNIHSRLLCTLEIGMITVTFTAPPA
jgi:hypothetical protein